jgi:hypothetical protein
MLKQSGELNFSADIKTHITQAMANLRTLDIARITDVNSLQHRVDIEIDVFDEQKKLVDSLPLKNVPYIVSTITMSGDIEESYVPVVGDRVLIGYVGKSFNLIVVIGKIGA